ncbi:MAG: serpin family protein [bacterium]|nr:serpin family protein [bacterium]
MQIKITNLVNVILPLCFTFIFSCAHANQSPEKEEDGIVPRITNPVVTNSNLTALVAGNSEFAFDLYKNIISGTNGNTFFSPFSISEALAMTYAGARTTTESEMADVLNFTLSQDEFHPAFNRLDSEVRSVTFEGAFEMNIANSIWGQKDYNFLTEFLTVLGQNYGAGMKFADFAGNPETARVEINNWVEDHTSDRIKDLIPQGVLDAMTKLVLANAIYFNADWISQFSVDYTINQPFTLLNGSEVTNLMMFQDSDYKYSEGEGWQAIEMPYVGETTSMVVILPAIERFDEVEQNLSTSMLEGIVNSFQFREVELTLPKFEFESAFALSDILETMGMTTAFEGGLADFSGMDGTNLLFIGEVLHKAFVKVDEEGTEAAAATAVVMKATADSIEPPEKVEFKADHPFIFLIRDIINGSILFLGRVLNPNE